MFEQKCGNCANWNPPKLGKGVKRQEGTLVLCPKTAMLTRANEGAWCNAFVARAKKS